MEGVSWGQQTPQDALRLLQSRLSGLSAGEAKKRYVAPRRHPWLMVRSVATDVAEPMTMALLVLAGVSWWLGDVREAVAIGALAMGNMGLTAVMLFRASKARAAVTKMLPNMVRVRRDGEGVVVPAGEVVVGDVVVLHAGERLVADGRLLRAEGLRVQEGALTGESVGVEKREGKDVLLWSGSVIEEGAGEMVVTAVGEETMVGGVAKEVVAAQGSTTPLMEAARKFTWRVTAVFGFTSVLLVLFLWWLGQEISLALWLGITLWLSALPESLPLLVGVCLAVSAERLSRRGVVVRRFAGAEGFGAVGVVLVDKTGTLTTGKMTVTEVRVGANKLPASQLSPIARELAAVAEPRVRNATEGALWDFVEAHAPGSTGQAIARALPFSSARKFSAVETVDGQVVVVGAADVLLARVLGEKGSWETGIAAMTAQGLRVLLLAKRAKSAELTDASCQQLTPVALLGITDPPRADAGRSLLRLREYGIRVVMVTGDHPETALHVARTVGLSVQQKEMLTGEELHGLSDKELLARLPSLRLVARVLPKDKVRLVRAYQARGESVGLLGDGVNDGAALAAADIGIAMGDGTDIAHEGADVILLHSALPSLVHVVEEGRRLHENVRRAAAYLMSFCLSEVVVVSSGVLVAGVSPLTPLQILLLNTLGDGLPAFLFAFRKRSGAHALFPDRALLPPRLTRGVILIGLGAGLVLGLLVALGIPAPLVFLLLLTQAVIGAAFWYHSTIWI